MWSSATSSATLFAHIHGQSLKLRDVSSQDSTPAHDASRHPKKCDFCWSCVRGCSSMCADVWASEKTGLSRHVQTALASSKRGSGHFRRSRKTIWSQPPPRRPSHATSHRKHPRASPDSRKTRSLLSLRALSDGRQLFDCRRRSATRRSNRL